MTLNNLVNDGIAAYFSNLISNSWHRPNIFFDTIRDVVTPASSTFLLFFFPIRECNKCLSLFVGKINHIRLNTGPLTFFPYLLLLSANNPGDFFPDKISQTWLIVWKLPLVPLTSYQHLCLKISLALLVLVCSLSVINNSLITGCVPAYFQQAVVQPLHKSNLDPFSTSKLQAYFKVAFCNKIFDKNLLLSSLQLY